MAAPAERGLLRVNRLIDTLPQIFPSLPEMEKARLDYSRELDDLLAAPPSLPDPLAVHRTMFYLCYQGRNDRDLNARLAQLFLRASPGLEYVAPHVRNRGDPGARPRVGFVSKFLGRHSIGTWYTSLVRLIIESGRFDCVLDVRHERRRAPEIGRRDAWTARFFWTVRSPTRASR